MELFRSRQRKAGVPQVLISLGKLEQTLEKLEENQSIIKDIIKELCDFKNLYPNRFNSLKSFFVQNFYIYNANLIGFSLHLVATILSIGEDSIESRRKAKKELKQLINCLEKLSIKEVNVFIQELREKYLGLIGECKLPASLIDDPDSLVGYSHMISVSKELQNYHGYFLDWFDEFYSKSNSLIKNSNSDMILSELVQNLKEFLFFLKLLAGDLSTCVYLDNKKKLIGELMTKADWLSDILESKLRKDSRNRLVILGKLWQHLMGLFSKDKS